MSVGFISGCLVGELKEVLVSRERMRDKVMCGGMKGIAATTLLGLALSVL